MRQKGLAKLEELSLRSCDAGDVLRGHGLYLGRVQVEHQESFSWRVGAMQ